MSKEKEIDFKEEIDKKLKAKQEIDKEIARLLEAKKKKETEETKEKEALEDLLIVKRDGHFFHVVGNVTSIKATESKIIVTGEVDGKKLAHSKKIDTREHESIHRSQQVIDHAGIPIQIVVTKQSKTEVPSDILSEIAELLDLLKKDE